MMKRITAFVVSALMILSLVPICVSAAEELPKNTVIVSADIKGESGKSENVTVGDKTYSVVVGKTGFKKVQEALDAVPAGGMVMLAAGEYTETAVIKKDVTILGPKAGIDPNVKGTKETDDWTRNPKRESGEAILKTSWHMGVNANSKEVYDCHSITIDGITLGNGAMLRSNLGSEGYITLNYKNIIVSGYSATNGNGPFYCYSYYPDRSTNLYKRTLNCENIRFESLISAPGFNLDVDIFNAKGIYFDSASTGKMFAAITVSDSTVNTSAVEYNITDSMFRQKTNQVLNCNFTEASAGHKFNANISNREKVSVNIKNNVFINNDSGAAQNNNIIVPQISTENVYFNISNNIFMQEGEVSSNFIAIHGATSALALGEKFTISENRFVNIPTALSMTNSTTPFDLTGNYFALNGQQASKPVVSGPSKADWWYIDYEMKTSSADIEEKIDAVFKNGTVDKNAKTYKDSINTDSYTFEIESSVFNTLEVYADKELKESLSSTIKLTNEVTTVYLKVSSAKGTVSEVYTATITTSSPDKLSVDIASNVRFFGRTYTDSNVHYFNWSSSGFTFSFKGSGAKATIVSNAPGGSNTAYIKIYIDGVEQPDVELSKATQEVVLASGLDKDKEHTIKVVKRTNARSSTAGVTSISLFDGEILKPTEASNRVIEFIGDSITVGYATVAGSSTTWSTSTEDSTKTYSEQIANAFAADYMVTAISGRGIVRNTGGDTDKLLPAIYPYIDQYNLPDVKYDFALQPDVIVINLGTNDASGSNSSLTSAEFKAGLKAFLKDVRAYNPNAEIVYAYGLMTTKYSEDIYDVIEELKTEGDSHIAYLRLVTCTDSEKQIGHPTAEAYVSRGNMIIAKIEQMTGWKRNSSDAPAETTPSETTTASPETTVPEVTVPDTTASDVTAASGKGCNSFAAIPALAVTATASALALKKKKKEND